MPVLAVFFGVNTVSRLYVSGRVVGMDQKSVRELLMLKGYIRSSAKSQYGDVFINLSHHLNFDIEGVVIENDEVGTRIILEVETANNVNEQKVSMYFHSFMRDLLKSKFAEADDLAEFCERRVKSIKSLFDIGSIAEVSLAVCGAVALIMAAIIPQIDRLEVLFSIMDSAMVFATFVFTLAISMRFFRLRQRHEFLLNRQQVNAVQHVKAVVASGLFAMALAFLGNSIETEVAIAAELPSSSHDVAQLVSRE